LIWCKCNCDVLSLEPKGFRVHQQMLNFMQIPCEVMNELLCEPTKHNHLQDLIHMFRLHLGPRTTKRSYQHCNKVYTWTFGEISNSDDVLFVNRNNIVNSSISKWEDINSWEKMHWRTKMLASQLLVCCCVNLLLCWFEDERSFHLFATMSCRPTTCIGWPHKVVATHNKHMGITWTLVEKLSFTTCLMQLHMSHAIKKIWMQHFLIAYNMCLHKTSCKRQYFF